MVSQPKSLNVLIVVCGDISMMTSIMVEFLFNVAVDFIKHLI